MSYKVQILPVAKRDIQKGLEWYNDQKQGLGAEFYTSVKSRIDYIQKNPFHYQIQYRNIRRAPVDRFPYSVYYELGESQQLLLIFGVIHTSRSPEISESRR